MVRSLISENSTFSPIKERNGSRCSPLSYINSLLNAIQKFPLRTSALRKAAITFRNVLVKKLLLSRCLLRTDHQEGKRDPIQTIRNLSSQDREILDTKNFWHLIKFSKEFTQTVIIAFQLQLVLVRLIRLLKERISVIFKGTRF